MFSDLKRFLMAIVVKVGAVNILQMHLVAQCFAYEQRSMWQREGNNDRRRHDAADGSENLELKRICAPEPAP